jgi:hypothetical protein
VITIPDVVTHLYDPAIGVCPNICSLSDFEALRVLDQLRRKFRPTLKSDYLTRRRTTERWLSEAASVVLGRRLDLRPGYFFLGDFSHTIDRSRPAVLTVPLSTLPPDAVTFTLGDSMSVVEQARRTVYSLDEVVALFADGDAVAGFGLSDGCGFQDRFVEVQLWDRSPLSALAALLDACDALTAERGLQRMEAGMNLNRSKAYRQPAPSRFS